MRRWRCAPSFPWRPPSRTTRTGHLVYWVAAGVLAGLGVSTHYRFVLAAAYHHILLDINETALRRQTGAEAEQEQRPISSIGSLDTPKKGQDATGPVVFSGWAFNDAAGVARVELLMDGEAVGQARYGGPFPSVRRVFEDSADTTRPNVGFETTWDSRGVEKSWRWAAIRVTSKYGLVDDLETRRIRVSHPG